MTCRCNNTGLVPSSPGSVFNVICPECHGSAHQHELLRAPDDLAARVAALQHRIDNVHEETDCPRCGAPRGDVCRYAVAPHHRNYRKPLKHPHGERLRRAGIALR